jgi:hypothetical protein
MRPEKFSDFGRHCARRVHFLNLLPPVGGIHHRDGKFGCIKTAALAA